MRNLLPTKVSLKHRGVLGDDTCPVCLSSMEYVVHVLKDCSYARLMWSVSSFSNSLIECTTVSLEDWLDFVRSKVTTEELSYLWLLVGRCGVIGIKWFMNSRPLMLWNPFILQRCALQV